MPRKESKGGGPNKNDVPGSSEPATISGTNGDDILSGLGGIFQLEGGNGNDTYIIDDTSDSIKERRSGDVDTVQSSIEYALGAHLEHLVLTGTADLSGTGNGLDNWLTGNSGNNVLTGLDGDDTLDGAGGNDTLDGGNGTDTAVFAGSLGDYSFDLVNGDILVTAADGEVDRLRNVEYLAFADQTVLAGDLPGPAPVPAEIQTTNDTATLAEDGTTQIDVLGNDTGDGLTLTGTTYSGGGSVQVNADGTLIYTPGANWHGQESFDYLVQDSTGATATGSVAVNVTAVNDGPVAVNDSFAVDASSPYSGTSLSANDIDADGDTLTVVSFSATSAHGGAVQVNADGTFAYTAANGFSGADSFSYTVSDGQGGTDTAVVSLSVTQPGEVPYYVEGLLYANDLWRLNAGEDAGTGVSVTYTFLDYVPGYISPSDPRGIHETFQAFTEQQRDATRAALQELSDMADITFVEVSSPSLAVVTLGVYDMGGDTKGAATYPYGMQTGNVYSDVWIDTQTAGDSFVQGTEGYYVMLHELAHALGLDHADLPVGEENRQYTVMDYTSHPTILSDATGYQLYDIAALQYLYGTNTTATAGDDVYGFADLDGQSKAIWDAGGTDTFDLSDAGYGVQVDLHDGAFSTIIATGTNNLSIALGAIIENVIGSDHDDMLVGNDIANIITGGAGNDVLTGGGATDKFVFASNWGNDVITDFEVGVDTLDFAAAGLGPNDLGISESGGDTLLEAGSDSVLLEGVTDFSLDMLA